MSQGDIGGRVVAIFLNQIEPTFQSALRLPAPLAQGSLSVAQTFAYTFWCVMKRRKITDASHPTPHPSADERLPPSPQGEG